jgi:hypothetical protein
MIRNELKEQAMMEGLPAFQCLHVNGLAASQRAYFAAGEGNSTSSSYGSQSSMSGGGTGDPLLGAFRVTVLFGQSSEPIAGAEVMGKKRYGTDLIKSVKKTGMDGMATFSPLEPGEYIYEVNKDGFAPDGGTCYVNAGSVTEVTVRLNQI